MRILHRLAGGLRALVGRRRVEQELDDELQAYLESSVEAGVRAGMSVEDARRAARIGLGSLDAVKDHTREVGWEAVVEQTWRDVRYAARTLRKAPAFSAVVVVTLTLGIGANTAIFSAVNAILLRSLPAERPEELVSVKAIYPDGPEPFSYTAYRRLAVDGAHLVDVLAASTTRREAVAVDGPPEAVDLKWVSGNYFTTLGIPATAGRPLLPSDDLQPPGAAVAVMSDAFWARRFGRDPAVVGRPVRLKGTPFVIVGIAASGFVSETPGESVDLWMPLSAQPGAPAWLWNGHSTTWLSLLGRRRQGVGLTEARAGLEAIYQRVRDDVAAGTDSAEFRRSVLDSRLGVADARGGGSRVRDNLAAPLLVLTAVVGLVLLVACANVASLMLTRAAARRREIAMSLALGAGRFRVIRQGLAEALLLAALGGAGGFVFAIWATSVLSALLAGVLPVTLDIRPDGRVLLFAALVSSVTALLSGLLPALVATRLDPVCVLRSGGGDGRGVSRVPFGRSLVVSQIAVSLVLLVVAGLFVRDLVALSSVNLGFDPDRVVLVRVNRSDSQVLTDGARREIYHRLLLQASAVPGVEGASASFSGVLSADIWRNVIAIEGVEPPDGFPLRSVVNAVTPDYFRVMRIAVLGGRGFDEGDRDGAPRVAIVNAAFVRQHLAGGDALGRRVGLCTSETCGPSTTGLMEIVAVVEDARPSNLQDPAPPMLYVPVTQDARAPREIQVRTTGDTATVVSTLYRTLTSADRRLTIVGMTTARERVQASLASQDTVARISSVFGLLALALAAVGLSGLVACMTAGRTHEIGIRMALGADRRDVGRLVLGSSVRLVATGAALGTAAALVVSRLLSGLLYRAEPYDPIVLSLSLGVLVIATLVAGYLPAARAARVDPVRALRAE